MIKNAPFFIFSSDSCMVIKPKSYLSKEVLVDNPKNVSLIYDTTAITTLMHRLPLNSITALGTDTFDQLDVESSLYVPLVGIVQQLA